MTAAPGRDAAALVLEGPGRLVLRHLERPGVSDDTAWVRVEACGLCGTDHEQFSGHLPAGFAFVPGHEVVGVIEEIGDEAARRWDLKAGTRVAVEVFQSCGRCGACACGEYRRCERHGIGDMYGFIAVERPPGLWGGYAQYQFLSPDSMLHRVPDGLDPVVATLFNPLGAGIRWGVTVPRTGPGDVVAVLGPGVRGLCAAAAAKDAGAAVVVVTGRGARDRPRLELAARFGADRTVDVEVEELESVLMSEVGRGADVVVDVTAKAPGAFGQAVRACRPGGTIVMAGTRGSGDTPGLWPDLIVYKELRILGALGVDAPAYAAALDMLASRRWPFEDMSRVVTGLDAVADLLSVMAGESEEVPPVHAVVDPWHDGGGRQTMR
ncbi:MAG: zinc-dependent alcohol dehydrogenase [Acidimicrobiales bacterium]